MDRCDRKKDKKIVAGIIKMDADALVEKTGDFKRILISKLIQIGFFVDRL